MCALFVRFPIFIHRLIYSCSIWRDTRGSTRAIGHMCATSTDAKSRMHNPMICWSIKKFILVRRSTNVRCATRRSGCKFSWESIIGFTMCRVVETTAKHSRFNESIHRYQIVHKIKFDDGAGRTSTRGEMKFYHIFKSRWFADEIYGNKMFSALLEGQKKCIFKNMQMIALTIIKF
jgi:hypothetical protein